jgi:hypothetical protein
MNTLEFLKRVLPSPPSLYFTASIKSGTDTPFKHTYFRDLDAMSKALRRMSDSGLDAYYAISAYNDCDAGRTQANVSCTKVIAIDVDCGPSKPYTDWKSGLQALGDFLAASKLPAPMVVGSGGGLHVYWVLTQPQLPTQWKPVADAVKEVAKAHGFSIDRAITGDNARILRPVGTINHKHNKEVKLLIDSPDVDFGVLSAAVSAYTTKVIPIMPAHLQHRDTGLSDSLKVRNDSPPAVAAVVAVKCQQVQWCTRQPADVPEPIWYSVMGIAAYCENPEETAMEWSKGHPQFSEAGTLKKLNQWRSTTTGPTTCARLEDLHPEGCKGCKYKDKVGTPIRLGVQYAEVPPAADAPANAANYVTIPKPFKRTADGIKLTIDESDIDVCKFDIYPVSYGRDDSLGYETVRYMWHRKHTGWTELTMRQALLTDKHRDFPTAIADQGIVLQNKAQTELFQTMLRAYMEELRQMRAMTNLYNSMGWKENNTQFILGDALIRKSTDGVTKIEQLNMASLTARLGQELYTTAGTLQDWVAFSKILDVADLRGHMFALAVGFSGPLYAFTGLKGLTISLYGATGGGKSLAQMWIQSIYGNPEKLHFSAKFTQNALFGRMGLYSHMPMTIDEVTLMDDKEVGDFAYWVSQGRDKARLSRTTEEREAKTWAMPVIVSTNKSLNSKLISSGLDTDAQMARILEVSMPPCRIFTADSTAGRKIYEFINDNHGIVGREFLKRLVELGPQGIKAAIAEATDTFSLRYKADFSGPERYWQQAIILADLAGSLAKQWGLINFDYTLGIEWVLSQIGAIRRAVTEFKMDAYDLLSEYFNETADAQIVVFHTGTAKPVMDFNRMPRKDLRVRFDFYRRTNIDPISTGTVLLDRTHLRRWLSNKGADYKMFIQTFESDNIICTPKSTKAYLAKDTPIKLGQSYVVGINLNHPRLHGLITDADESLDNMLLGQIKSVNR